MPDWVIPLLGGVAALLTAIGVLYAHNRKAKNDLIDQLQEERNRLDKKLEDSDAKHSADNASMSSRIDTLVTGLNAAQATNAVKDLHIAILTNHVHSQNLRIEKHDPPADPFPILPELPQYPTYV